MDHIRVSVNGNDKLAEIAQKNKKTIADKVLADELSQNVTYQISKQWNVNGEEVTISLEKI